MIKITFNLAIFTVYLYFASSIVLAQEQPKNSIPVQVINASPAFIQNESGAIAEDPKNAAVTRLENEIGKRLSHIQQLENEIAESEMELLAKQQQAQSVRNEAYVLNVSKNKTESEAREVENNIQKKDKKLRDLSARIIKTERDVYILKHSLRGLYQNINELEHSEIILSAFSKEGVLRVLKNSEDLKNTKLFLIDKILEIKRLEEEFRDIEFVTKSEKNNLSSLSIDLNNKKRVLTIAVQEKEKLLKQTNGDEQIYLDILKEKQDARSKLLEEIFDYEAKLKFSLDPTQIPSKGTKIFSRPFEGFYTLTQKFGATRFAVKSGRYANAFHDGVDWGTPRGTRIISAAGGVVSGLGNTDLSSNCPWYGKWITIDHKNGLTSLYAHLDIQRVFPGQAVNRGDLLGYSGNTGNSTGPHLHFSVYATAGFKIVPYSQFSTKRRCIGILLPIAAKEAKLDPLDYLSTS